MPDFEARCGVLEQENELLHGRVAELEEMLGITFHSPLFLELTASEAKIFGILLAREAVTKSLVMTCLYGSRPDGDMAEEKIVDVFICRLRAKLKTFGIEIGTNWGQGYFMTPAMKARVRGLIDERAAA